jgi:hypothetical protein
VKVYPHEFKRVMKKKAQSETVTHRIPLAETRQVLHG